MSTVSDAFIAQICLDYCLDPSNLTDGKNHFTVFTPLDGRRTWRNEQPTFLKAVCFNSQLFMTGHPEVISLCREKFLNDPGEWFMDQNNIRRLDLILEPFGYRTESMHPFFLPKEDLFLTAPAFTFKRYDRNEIGIFRGDSRFKDAFAFDPSSPDELGIAALDEAGEILGMAGASSDGRYLWQIGVNVLPGARGNHIASSLVNLLSHDVLATGHTPFYGTSLSHIVSQKVACNAGFIPGWSELSTSPISKG